MKKSIYYIIPIIMVCLLSTLVQAWVPFANRTWILLLVGTILSLIITIKNGVTSFHKWWFIYSIIVLINALAGNRYFSSVPNAFVEVLSILLPFQMMSMYFDAEKKERHYLIVSFGLFFIVTFIGTVIVNNIVPGAMRATVGYLADGDSSIVQYLFSMGLSNYLLPHAVQVLVPFIVYVIKFAGNTHKRIFYITFLVFVVWFIWLSESSTSILLTILGLVLGFFFRKDESLASYLKRMAIPLIIVLIVFSFKDFMASFLGQAAELFSGDVTNNRFSATLEEFQEVLQGGKGDDIESRKDLYGQSLDNFFQSPIWGTNTEFGGHSALMDRLASIGLLGTIPFVAIIIKAYKYVSIKLSSGIRPVYLTCFFMGVVMMAAKNMANIEMWIVLLCVMPICVFSIDKDNIK